MRKTLLFFLFIIIVSFIKAGSVTAQEMITLRLPQQIISQAITAMLPYKVNTQSKSLSGDITIINISEIALSDNLLTCRLHLAGDNLALNTEIAGHKIKLNVGSTELDFTADAAIRFDEKQQILYVKPLVRQMSGNGAGEQADVGQALVALFHGQEFPIQMQKLEPLIAKTGTKVVVINSHIANIAAVAKAIQIGLVPVITTQ